MKLETETLRARVAEARDVSGRALLAERVSGGWWDGRLSSSALATATAVMALELAGGVPEKMLIGPGVEWLVRTQREDGGWGDTPESLANLSTTLLVVAALRLAGGDGVSEVLGRAMEWVRGKAGGVEPEVLARALEARYGKDRTFSVPIMMACAIGGVLGSAPDCWRHVPQLPFELASLPRRWYAALQLPVVSYALPALIAIGQVRLHHRPGKHPLTLLRWSQRARTLKLLEAIQPEGGGYLEATPLTAFVTMALASAGLGRHAVVRKAVGFLTASARSDGSWPIDTNLATWVTSLSVKALAGVPGAVFDSRPAVAAWMRAQQTTEVHEYTLSAPGAWGWTDLPGGVPDADDTSAALLALAVPGMGAHDEAAAAGVQWLLGLQNRDGGMPTFCRGWGALPFDRSTPEITAHALAALHEWRHLAVPGTARAMESMERYLAKTQEADGSWLPLWFGNEHARGEANPVYGTACVLRYLQGLAGTKAMCDEGAAYLVGCQRSDGAWSGAGEAGPATVEETALAVHALALSLPRSETAEAVLGRGAEALLRLTDDGREAPAAPIGLYFARLWYHERLYPRIFQTAALAALAVRWRDE